MSWQPLEVLRHHQTAPHCQPVHCTHLQQFPPIQVHLLQSSGKSALYICHEDKGFTESNGYEWFAKAKSHLNETMDTTGGVESMDASAPQGAMDTCALQKALDTTAVYKAVDTTYFICDMK